VFLVAPPRALLIVDEERYVAQAVAFADGARAIEGAGRRYEGIAHGVMSDYPPGTSLLQTPFVWAFGWRYAGLASVLALVLATLATARLLRLHGRDERFALLVPGFLGAAFFARIGMSDVPSAMIVALALWQLREGTKGSLRGALVGGFLAGASILFRETNTLLIAPFLAAALWSRSALAMSSVVSAVLGAAMRPLLSALIFGNAWYLRDSEYGFSFASLASAVPLWLVILLVMLPAALWLPFAYRGDDRRPAIAAFVLYFGLYASYGYDALSQNGLVKGALLTSRYAVPALPLLAMMAAEVWPRLAVRLSANLQSLIPRAVPSLAIGVAVMVGGVQFAARGQEAVAAAIIEPLYVNTDPALPVVINELALVKYASPVYGVRQILYRRDVGEMNVTEIAATETFVIGLLDRFDSEMFDADVSANQRFLDKLIASCSVGELHDGNPAPWARLRIYRVSDCREDADGA
jgi:hypothetical protein